MLVLESKQAATTKAQRFWRRRNHNALANQRFGSEQQMKKHSTGRKRCRKQGGKRDHSKKEAKASSQKAIWRDWREWREQQRRRIRERWICERECCLLGEDQWGKEIIEVNVMVWWGRRRGCWSGGRRQRHGGYEGMRSENLFRLSLYVCTNGVRNEKVN